jgi:hypothetical protein
MKKARGLRKYFNGCKKRGRKNENGKKKIDG